MEKQHSMRTQQVCKDLAYSHEQLVAFLRQMQGVVILSVCSHSSKYTFGAVRIHLEAQSVSKGVAKGAPKSVIRPLPRCYMYLEGDEAQIQAFYTTFMLHHMTMGG